MNGLFNGQILVDKLAKLNNSQQSIETLSHWCIFHRNKAKQVVETWERQFHCSPSEQRVSFLYLANDILQNSRRKGLEFINEFWKVLPDALTDVFANGGDFGRKTVLRLVDIWEERKVFGSRGQILKEDILGRKFDNRNKNGNAINYKLKQSSGELLEKIISSYAHVCDEDALFGKCQAAISIVDKVEKEVGSDIKLGSINGSEVIGELQMQHSILGECIEQLKAAELSRATLISFLREALHEQETKIEQIRHQLEAAESRCKQASNISAQLNSELPTEQRPREPLSAFSDTAPGFVPEATASSGDATQITPARHTQEEPLSENNSSHTEEEHRKTAAAAVAAKLTASASSAQMLSYVLSSLASEGVIGQANKEGSPPENKRPKIENNVPSHVLLSQPLLQPPMPFFPHSESLHQLPPPEPLSPMAHPSSSMESVLLPPPSLPLTQPPLLPITTQFMQTAAGPMTGVPYTYGSAPPPLPNYPMFGMHPNPSAPIPYHSFQASEGANLFVQPPLSTAPPPLTRQ